MPQEAIIDKSYYSLVIDDSTLQELFEEILTITVIISCGRQDRYDLFFSQLISRSYWDILEGR